MDRCVECGYCEPVCPSRDLTLDARGSGSCVRRAIRARRAGRRHARWPRGCDDDYDYDGRADLAVDGMCQTACPVLINTGDLVKRLRRHDQSAAGRGGLDARRRSTGAR